MFAQRGDRVAVLDRNLDFAKATVEACRSAGGDALAIACDVSHENQVSAAFRQTAEQFGPCWGVFANAGIDVGGLMHDLAFAKWNEVIATNLTGIFLTCKYGLRQMMDAQIQGSIVCTSSPCGSVALPVGGVGAYSATKGGISALVRCMAVDYARYGIRVNAIVPGATETGMMWNNVAADEIQRMRSQLN